MTDALYADEMDLFSLTTPKFIKENQNEHTENI